MRAGADLRKGLRAAVLAGAAAIAASCEIAEVTVTEPVDLVVAEIVLDATAARQLAFLHRTVPGPAGLFDVGGANIRVRSGSGGLLTFAAAPLDACVEQDSVPRSPRGSCYVSAEAPGFVRPGEAYTLEIDVAGGGRLTGSTRVPGPFALQRPSAAECRLAPGTQLPLVWRRAPHAWAYVVEASFTGLRAALEPLGIEVPDEPFRLVGVSISATDTTKSFPSEIGVFGRFDSDLTPLLVALQAGLPANVDASIAVAAVDRNYVNWVRGGAFNPSGRPRIASVGGAGTGVFGALAAEVVTVRVRAAADGALPDC
jgi:hypothetical protein